MTDLTPQAFVAKWRGVTLKERSANQSQFNNLCAVLGLTNLYNQRPTWLDLAHRRLDEAVFAAYGWPVALSDEEILERLLALNLARATG